MTVAYPRLTPCHPAGKTFELWNLLPRYVHPAVMQAAEAGCVASYTEIPTDDVALQVGQRGDDMSNSKETLRKLMLNSHNITWYQGSISKFLPDFCAHMSSVW